MNFKLLLMKIIRYLLIGAASILILSQGFFTILFIVRGLKWDDFFLPTVLIILGALFLFIASRINKKIKRKKDLDLVKSLPE